MELRNMRWYSVRCVLAFDAGAAKWGYEERITLWERASFEEALTAAQREAEEYASNLGARFLGTMQAYELSESPGSGAEVFSLIRESRLPAENYLQNFFTAGGEHQKMAP
jgi:hypothetical protein